MSAAVTNPYSIYWGTFQCGGTTERLIVGSVREEHQHERSSVTFDVLVRGTTDATLAANCAEIISEFSKRRQRVRFLVGTEERFDGDPSDNSGLNTFASAAKAGTQGADTDRSALYTITLGYEKPSTDTSGRRDGTFTITYAPSKRRTVTFNGTWTAVSGSGALAQFESAGAAWMSSALGGLTPSATFEQVAKNVTPDDQDDTCTFAVTYAEILANQSTGTLNDSSIVDPALTFEQAIDAPGDSGDGAAHRLETYSVHFECSVDKVQTQSLATLYRDTIRPYIRAQFIAGYNPDAFAFSNERHRLARYTNTISADLLIVASRGGGELLESTESEMMHDSGAVVLTGAWTGKLFDKYLDIGHGQRRRFTVRQLLLLGRHRAVKRQPGQRNGNWVLLDSSSKPTVKWLGQSGGDGFYVTLLEEQIVEEWVTTPSEGGTVQGGGSGDSDGTDPEGDAATSPASANPRAGSGWQHYDAGSGRLMPGLHPRAGQGI